MMHTFRLLGDFFHAASIILFLVIVGVKGNGAGVSLKSQYLFLLTFFLRYLDLFTKFYNWYNTLMKIFFILTTMGIVFILRRVEPAKSTYSPTQDSVSHWNLIMAAAIAGMVIHLVGSGVVDIRGSSGQEFEVHFEHYSWLSFFWTFSVCLEPLAMLPQLYIFRKNRLISRDIRTAIVFMGIYRLCYLLFWGFRAASVEHFQHHYLLYTSGIVQCLTYIDFCLYHWSVCTLWCLSKYGGSDSSSMVEDSGIGPWAMKAAGYDEDPLDEEVDSLLAEVEEEWRPGDKPASKMLEMKTIGKLGII